MEFKGLKLPFYVSKHAQNACMALFTYRISKISEAVALWTILLKNSKKLVENSMES